MGREVTDQGQDEVVHNWEEDGSTTVDFIADTSIFEEDETTGEAVILGPPGPLVPYEAAEQVHIGSVAPQLIYVDQETQARVVPAAVPRKTGTQPGPMTPYEAFVFDLIDGTTSVGSIQRAGLLSQAEVTGVLYNLLDRALIEIDQPPPISEEDDERTSHLPNPFEGPAGADLAQAARVLLDTHGFSALDAKLAPVAPAAAVDDGSSSDLRWIPSVPADQVSEVSPSDDPFAFNVAPAMPLQVPLIAPVVAAPTTPSVTPAPRAGLPGVPRGPSLLPPPPMIAGRLSNAPSPSVLDAAPAPPALTAVPSVPPVYDLVAPPISAPPEPVPPKAVAVMLAPVAAMPAPIAMMPAPVAAMPAPVAVMPAPVAAPPKSVTTISGLTALPAEPPSARTAAPRRATLPPAELPSAPAKALPPAATTSPRSIAPATTSPRAASAIAPPPPSTTSPRAASAIAPPRPGEEPPKLDSELLAEIPAQRSPLLRTVSSTAHYKAKQLFEAALADRAKDDLVSARMNLKLAIAFDPSNTKYQRIFLEVGEQAAPSKIPPKLASPQGQRAFDEGCSCELKGDVDAAIRHFESALKHGEDPVVLNRLGVLLAMKKSDFMRSQSMLERAIELSPDNAIYQHNLTKVLTRAAGQSKNKRGSKGNEPANKAPERKPSFFQRLFGRDGQ